MDPVMFALLFGFFGICIVWTLSKNLAGRWERRAAEARGEHGDSREGEDAAPEDMEAVYRRSSMLKAASLALCLLAVGALYLRFHIAVPLCLAGVALALQWQSFSIRTRHLRARRLVPPGRR